MSVVPRFSPSSPKALEVILWLANACPQIDVYHLVKACFFADKEHVSLHGRTIAGDNYDAAPYGPLAEAVYGLINKGHIDMLALGGNGVLPFNVDDKHCVTADREANLRKLSLSEIEALSHGLEHVKNKTFDEIYRETHGDPAYLNANGGKIDPRDFIADDAIDKEAKAQDILESAAYIAY